MIPARRPRMRAILLSIFMGGVGLCAMAQAADPPQKESDSGMSLPPGIEIEFGGTARQTDDGGAMFTGPVTLTAKGIRIQADQLLLRDGRYIEAEGNVLLVWGKNRVFGKSLSYDLEEERGTIEDAIGYALDEYLILAKTIEKIGENKLRLKKATITTCNPFNFDLRIS